MVFNYGYFGFGNGPVFMTNVYCDETKTTVLDCGYKTNTLSCGHAMDAGVACLGKLIVLMFTYKILQNGTLDSCKDGDVRLSGPSSAFAGRVEICIEQTWTTVCDQFWEIEEAAVVCRQLNYSAFGN